MERLLYAAKKEQARQKETNLTETIKIDIEWKRKSEWYADRIEE